MSNGLSTAPGREIIDTILQEARAHADGLIKNAHAMADTELAHMRQEAKKLCDAVLEQARKRAENTCIKATASANMEARKILLGARETVVSRVLEKIGKQLESLRGQPEDYRRCLIGLAVESALAIGGEKVILSASHLDAALVDEGFLEEVRHGIGAAIGAPMEIVLRLEEQEVQPGCRTSSPEGRIVFDNRLHRRLERARASLRAQIVEEIKT